MSSFTSDLLPSWYYMPMTSHMWFHVPGTSAFQREAGNGPGDEANRAVGHRADWELYTESASLIAHTLTTACMLQWSRVGFACYMGWEYHNWVGNSVLMKLATISIYKVELYWVGLRVASSPGSPIFFNACEWRVWYTKSRAWCQT